MNVTAGAVSQWEMAESKGAAKVATIEKALSAMGETLTMGSRPIERFPLRMSRREDRVSLELHREISRKLIDDPTPVLAVVPDNVRKMRTVAHGIRAQGWLDDWERLAMGSLGELIEAMLGSTAWSRDLRQNSPFAGVLSQEERIRAIQRAAA